MSEAFDPYHRWLGIHPKDQPPHHYRLLGIDLYEDDAEVIRDAAERQMAHVRKYQLGQHSAISQKILNELAAAKACLLDRNKKTAYDAAIEVKLNAINSSAERLEQSQPPPPLISPSITHKYPVPDVDVAATTKTADSIDNISSLWRHKNWLFYIGSGIVAILAGCLFVMFAMRGNDQDEAKPKFNNQIANNTNPTTENPLNTLAGNVSDGNDTPEKQSGNLPKTLTVPSNVSPGDNHSATATYRSLHIPPTTVKTELKPGIVEEPNKYEPIQRPETPNADLKKSASGKSMSPKDRLQIPLEDMQKNNPSKNGLPQTNSITINQPAPKYKPTYSSSSAFRAISLHLPSGKTLNSQLLYVDLKDIENKFKFAYEKQAKDAEYKMQVFLLGSMDSTHAWAEQDNGKIDGELLAFYDRRTPKIYAQYIDGKYDGKIATWSENGQRVYWCQYKKGVRQGLCCFFKDDILRIIFEIKDDKCTAIHLCNNSELTKSFDSLEEASSDEDANIFIKELTSEKSEVDNTLRDYAKQFNKEFKKMQNILMGKIHRENLEDIQNRMKQRGIEHQKMLDEQRRRGGQ
jgi:hypothetical protein